MPMQLPLTFQQQWLWDLIQRYPDWRVILTYVLRVSGALNPELLQTSLAEVIRRRDALRTRIISTDASVWQEIDEPHAFRLDVVSIPGNTRREVEANSIRFLEAFADRKIDPAVAPLLSFGLFRVGEHEHLLVMTIHRMIADCVSVDLIFQEIWQLYGELAKGQLPSPAKTPPQYSDYAQWQQRTYDGWLAKHGAYWRDHLAGVVPMEWPTARVSKAKRGDIGRMKCLIGEALSAQLREAARGARTLAATYMLSIYVAVLARWCRQSDFVVPFNIAGRQSEHKYVVGYFSHVLYLRLRLTGQETFSELLAQVANEFFRGLTHDDFGTMARQLPALQAGTFFQWISWHKGEAAGNSTASATSPSAERFPFREFGEGLTAIPPGLVDVEVSFFDTDEGIYALGVYRADLFTPDMMEEFVQTLRSAAEEFVRDPQARIAPLPAETCQAPYPFSLTGSILGVSK